MSKISKRALKYKQDGVFRDLFARFMEKGSSEFGLLWLQANNAAATKARDAGMDVTEPQTKAAITIGILHALYSTRRHCQDAGEQLESTETV